MDQMINDMIEAGGLPAFVVGMAIIIKYILTIFFLSYGISYFASKRG